MRARRLAGLAVAAICAGLLGGCETVPAVDPAALQSGPAHGWLPPKPLTDSWPDVAPLSPAAEKAARQTVGVMIAYQLALTPGHTPDHWAKGYGAVRKHAYQGNPVAQAALCVMLKWQHGTPPETPRLRAEQALAWCRASAGQGYARGQVAAGQLLTGALAPLAAESLRAAATTAASGTVAPGSVASGSVASGSAISGAAAGQGADGAAAANLAAAAKLSAEMQAEAAHWFRQAAMQGDPLGRLELARAYAEGRGVPRDPDAAQRLLAPLLRLQRPDGDYARSLIYRYALGVHRSSGLANLHLRKAAAGNFWLAEADLGLLYGQGTVAGDVPEIGAAGNEAISGGAVSDGEGLPRDPAMATYWRKKAEWGDLESTFFPLLPAE